MSKRTVVSLLSTYISHAANMPILSP